MLKIEFPVTSLKPADINFVLPSIRGRWPSVCPSGRGLMPHLASFLPDRLLARSPDALRYSPKCPIALQLLPSLARSARSFPPSLVWRAFAFALSLTLTLSHSLFFSLLLFQSFSLIHECSPFPSFLPFEEGISSSSVRGGGSGRKEERKRKAASLSL